MSNDLVLKALQEATKPLKSADIVAATGLDKDTVAKAIKALKKEGLVISPKNCYYAPATAEKEA